MTEVPFSSVAPESRRVHRTSPNDRREEVLPEGKDKTTRNVHDKRVPGSLKKVLLRHATSGGKSPKKRRRKNESEK
jgi:hypothetical protein